MTLSTVILAAGQGKRMHSQAPKILHMLAGKPLLEHVVNTIYKVDAGIKPFVVYGHQGEKVKHTLAHLNVNWVEQKEQLGTGHALQQTLPHIPDNHRVLVLYGDVPLISEETLKNFLKNTAENALGIITANFPNPAGLGRVIRDGNKNIIKIVEDKDASEQERAINEINSGIYLIPAKYLQKWLGNLNNNNAQQEYYLTSIIHMAVAEKVAIHALQPKSYEEVLGINDRMQLNQLERYYQINAAEKLMRRGVTIMDPARFDLRGELSVGTDVTIDINVIFEGHVKIGNHCVIGANSILRNVVLADHVEIKPNCVIDGAEIATNCVIGPFARIRQGTVIAAGAQVGNFAEIKNSYIGEGTKVHHVSYLGDAQLGNKVNVGAGTITCNYDGINKHKTIIGNNVFIGSNSEIVAPVTIGDGAYIGAGSTITRNAPEGKLTLARSKQVTIEGWKKKEKGI